MDEGCKACGSIEIKEIAKRMVEMHRGIEGSENWKGILTVNWTGFLFEGLEECKNAGSVGLCQRFREEGPTIPDCDPAEEDCTPGT